MGNPVELRVCQRVLDDIKTQIQFNYSLLNDGQQLDEIETQVLDPLCQLPQAAADETGSSETPEDYYQAYIAQREQLRIINTYYYYQRHRRAKFSLPSHVDRELYEALRAADSVKTNDEGADERTVLNDYVDDQLNGLVNNGTTLCRYSLIKEINQRISERVKECNLNKDEANYQIFKPSSAAVIKQQKQLIKAYQDKRKKARDLGVELELDEHTINDLGQAIKEFDKRIEAQHCLNALYQFQGTQSHKEYDKKLYETLNRLNQIRQDENRDPLDLETDLDFDPEAEYTAEDFDADYRKTRANELYELAQTPAQYNLYNCSWYNKLKTVNRALYWLSCIPQNLIKAVEVNSYFDKGLRGLNILRFPLKIAGNLSLPAMKLVLGCSRLFLKDVPRIAFNTATYAPRKLYRWLGQDYTDDKAQDKLYAANQLKADIAALRKGQSDESIIGEIGKDLDNFIDGCDPDGIPIESQSELVHHYLDIKYRAQRYATYLYASRPEDRVKVPWNLIDEDFYGRLRVYQRHGHLLNFDGDGAALAAVGDWEVRETLRYYNDHAVTASIGHKFSLQPDYADHDLLDFIKEVENTIVSSPEDKNSHFKQYLAQEYNKLLKQESSQGVVDQAYNIINAYLQYYNGLATDGESVFFDDGKSQQQDSILKTLKQKAHTLAKRNGHARRLVQIRHDYKNTLPENLRELLFAYKDAAGHNQTYYLPPTEREIDQLRHEVIPPLPEEGEQDKRGRAPLGHETNEIDILINKLRWLHQQGLIEKETLDAGIEDLKAIAAGSFDKAYNVEARRHHRHELKKVLKRYNRAAASVVGFGEGVVAGYASYQAGFPIEFAVPVGVGGGTTNVYLMGTTGENTLSKLYLNLTFLYDKVTGRIRSKFKQGATWATVISSFACGLTLGCVSFVSNKTTWASILGEFLGKSAGLTVVSTITGGFIAVWTGFAVQQMIFSAFADFFDQDRGKELKNFIKSLSMKNFLNRHNYEARWTHKIRYAVWLVTYLATQALFSTFGLVTLTLCFLGGVAMQAALAKNTFHFFYGFLGIASNVSNALAQVASNIAIWLAFSPFNVLQVGQLFKTIGKVISAVAQTVYEQASSLYTKPKETLGNWAFAAAAAITLPLWGIPGVLGVLGYGIGVIIKESLDNREHVQDEAEPGGRRPERALFGENSKKRGEYIQQGLYWILDRFEKAEQNLSENTQLAKLGNATQRMMGYLQDAVLTVFTVVNGIGQAFLGLSGVQSNYGFIAKALIPVATLADIAYGVSQGTTSSASNENACLAQTKPAGANGYNQSADNFFKQWRQPVNKGETPVVQQQDINPADQQQADPESILRQRSMFSYKGNMPSTEAYEAHAVKYSIPSKANTGAA